jgi:hypothetical protein
MPGTLSALSVQSRNGIAALRVDPADRHPRGGCVQARRNGTRRLDDLQTRGIVDRYAGAVCGPD